MNDIYKTVYFRNAPLWFVASKSDISGLSTERTFVTDDYATLSPANIIKLFEKYDSVLLVSSQIENDFRRWSSYFKTVYAAGGIVVNPRGEVAMMLRNGIWDLPKGHIEQGESAEQCAVREIEEEIGARGLKIASFLCNTMHSYNVYGMWELKTTSWYRLEADTAMPLCPQAEEGIERALWCDADTVERNLRCSYRTIIDVFEHFEK